ncbi:tail fiber protein [Pasteurella phage vB_PmuP_PS07]|nr:tail fiber protein [Pasteurella phage vB_PmuP_PS07]UIS74050.1 tail fiber protein [Pasteurella phage vB_PmuP_PS30]
MPLYSQSIKNLKSGISQQPEILKYPEQGNQQINGWSSEIAGLQKRPPIIFNKMLGQKGLYGDAPFIHLINRDEHERYYAIFTGSGIRVIGLDGTPYVVKGDFSYVRTDNPRKDLRMITVADYTFVVNTAKVIKEDTSKNLPNFNDKQDALINVRGGQYGRTLIVGFNGAEQAKYVIPNGDRPEHVKNTDSQFIAEELAKQMREKLSTWTFTVGQGYIHIQAPQGTSIENLYTKDGYADQLLNPVTHYVQTFNKLPLVAPDGYMVKIVGDTSKTSDSYYVKYSAAKKVWAETLGWDTPKGFLDNTMPHTLVRESDGTFSFKVHEWKQRRCGDEDTNPLPSFVDSSITDIFFYRNRLGFLSGENVILSRTSRYFDFFPASVANNSDDDPIDVAISHNRISNLKFAVPFSEELLLWSDEAQFTLRSSSVLSARTIELNLVTEFDVSDQARPFGIGRGIYFANPRSTFTSISRYYAVQDVSSVRNAEDMTAHVPNYIPNGVFSIHGSNTENFCTVLTEGAPSKIFIYKYLYMDEQLLQQSWSHWDLGEECTILACTTIGSKMTILFENQHNVFIGTVRFTRDIKDFPQEPYRSHLDLKTLYTIPTDKYNITTNITRIRLIDIYKGAKFTRGKVTLMGVDGRNFEFQPKTDFWASDDTMDLQGDYSGQQFVVGFNIPFTYEFAKFLIKKADKDGSMTTEDIGRLQLRRAWVNYEESGAFSVKVVHGSTSFNYEMAGSRLGSRKLRIGELNISTDQFRFPVTGNALHTQVFLLSDSPTPLNIIGCGWEGSYIRRSRSL